MTDTYERAFKEAESWLSSARQRLLEAENDEASATVCCSLSIHAIIRANDALSLKFLGHKATRHDDAAAIFAKLSREGKLPAGASDFKDTVADAMRDKSGADYGKASFTYENAKDYVERAEEFVAMARDALNLYAEILPTLITFAPPPAKTGGAMFVFQVGLDDIPKELLQYEDTKARLYEYTVIGKALVKNMNNSKYRLNLQTGDLSRFVKEPTFRTGGYEIKEKIANEERPAFLRACLQDAKEANDAALEKAVRDAAKKIGIDLESKPKAKTQPGILRT